MFFNWLDPRLFPQERQIQTFRRLWAHRHLFMAHTHLHVGIEAFIVLAEFCLRKVCFVYNLDWVVVKVFVFGQLRAPHVGYFAISDVPLQFFWRLRKDVDLVRVFLKLIKFMPLGILNCGVGHFPLKQRKYLVGRRISRYSRASNSFYYLLAFEVLISYVQHLIVKVNLVPRILSRLIYLLWIQFI